MAGVALVIPVTRPVGVLFTGALGIAFITLGVLARVKRAEASCGCFGRAEGHPFGLRNSLIGLALFVVAVVDGVSPDSRQSAEPGVALALTAAGCVCLSVWLHRKMIIVLLGPRVRISTSQEVEA